MRAELRFYTESLRYFRWVLILGIAVYIIERINTRLDLLQVEGTVIRINEGVVPGRFGASHAKHYYPSIRYEIEGKEHFYIKRNELYFQSFEEGDKVSLLIDTRTYDDKQSYFNSFAGFWLPFPRVLAFAMLMLGAFAVTTIVTEIFR